jgi:single-stranded-DNA-specific exonuclease
VPARAWRLESSATLHPAADGEHQASAELLQLFTDLVIPKGQHLPLATLLHSRELAEPTAARHFLDRNARTLHDPHLLPDATGLIARLRAAGEEGEPILVVGDFDADGLTGAAIIIRALRAIGAIAEGYIPQRDGDGHGIPEGAITAALEDGVELILAVDCGTADRERVAEALEAGILVGIIDHHAVPPEPAQAAWLVNPNRPDSIYPFPSLAGSGLAFKIAQGILADHPQRRELLAELSVLAMVGGIADMVPVADEFRVIVRSALKVMNGAGKMPVGIAALLRAAGAEPPYRADVSGFTISPRVNAAGRIGDAAPALALLTTDDPSEAAELATLLEGINLERKELTKAAIDEARGLLGLLPGSQFDEARAFLGDGLVAVRGPWSVGLIGLIAGRLSEETGRPALVAHDDGSGVPLRASVRAPKGFAVAAALQEASEMLIRHGGHDGAGGCSFSGEMWEELLPRLSATCAGQAQAHTPELTVDLVAPIGSRTPVDLAELADHLAPAGVGNPEPTFLLRDIPLTAVRLVGEGRHARLTLSVDGEAIEAIAFGRPDADRLAGSTVDLVVRTAQRTYRGAARIEVHVVDLRSAVPGEIV